MDDSYYKTVKTSLKSIVKTPETTIPLFTEIVGNVQTIAFHGLNLLKLYLLHYYESNNQTLPVINKDLIISCFNVVCTKQKGKPLKSTSPIHLMQQFYNEHYEPLIVKENLWLTGLDNTIKYMSETFITCYENNIKQHYIQYVQRYVNVMLLKDYIIEKIRNHNLTKKRKQEKIKKLLKTLRQIKNDILNVDESKEYTSHVSYHSWIKKQKELILPHKSFKENSIYYDLKCSPFDYLPSMIHMMKEVEKRDRSVYSIFPLRTKIIPKYIRIDTSLINLLFLSNKNREDLEITRYKYKSKENEIWNLVFKTSKRDFKKKNYSFHHMIETDGVGCSIIFLKSEWVGKHIPMQQGNKTSEPYITEYNGPQTKKIVAGDPGKEDLVYFVDGCEKNSKTFRYSQAQRRKETKKSKYKRIVKNLKENTMIETYENELSNHNSKTLNIEKFKNYIATKSLRYAELSNFYGQYIFRKLRLNAFINTMQSEQRMIKNFSQKFGSPKECIIGMGDWEQKQQMKFKEPTKGIGMRRLFRKYGYEVYLVDEFRTTCKCSICCNETTKCKKFMLRENPKPFKEGLRYVHGLLRCKNDMCRMTWNRDRNGASNIYKICRNAMNGLERPQYLKRSIQALS